MKADAHILKFRRLDAALDRLDPVSDRELWIWTAMNAGVHLLNAALHRCGVTDEVDSFHTQVEGLYAGRTAGNDSLIDRVHAPGDVMHVGQPPLARAVPPELAVASQRLREIEDLREPFVRGSVAPAAGAEAGWRTAYEESVARLCAALRMPRRTE
jgi:hypothetical protein